MFRIELFLQEMLDKVQNAELLLNKQPFEDIKTKKEN